MSRYRVWCLEELRRQWQDLDGSACERLRAHLRGCGSAVLEEEALARPSEYDSERRAPFHRAINVFADGVPR